MYNSPDHLLFAGVGVSCHFGIFAVCGNVYWWLCVCCVGFCVLDCTLLGSVLLVCGLSVSWVDVLVRWCCGFACYFCCCCFLWCCAVVFVFSCSVV